MNNYKQWFYYFLTLLMSIIGIRFSGINWNETNHLTALMVFGLVGFGMWIEYYSLQDYEA